MYAEKKYGYLMSRNCSKIIFNLKNHFSVDFDLLRKTYNYKFPN